MATKLALEEVEAGALRLCATDRAHLVGSIVRSLQPPEQPAWDAWLAEAERRDEEMGADPNAGIPADEVLSRARARLR